MSCFARRPLPTCAAGCADVTPWISLTGWECGFPCVLLWVVQEDDPATHVPDTAPERFVVCMSAARMWEEVFDPDKSKPVLLDRSSIDFGPCSHLRVSDYQQVRLP